MRISKRINEKIYPKKPTYEDLSLYIRLKTLNFVSYEDLKIPSELQLDDIWQLAGLKLRLMEKVRTAAEKLACIT